MNNMLKNILIPVGAFALTSFQTVTAQTIDFEKLGKEDAGVIPKDTINGPYRDILSANLAQNIDTYFPLPDPRLGKMGLMRALFLSKDGQTVTFRTSKPDMKDLSITEIYTYDEDRKIFEPSQFIVHYVDNEFKAQNTIDNHHVIDITFEYDEQDIEVPKKRAKKTVERYNNVIAEIRVNENMAIPGQRSKPNRVFEENAAIENYQSALDMLVRLMEHPDEALRERREREFNITGLGQPTLSSQ